MSSFEFISDFDQACREIGRVLAPRGAFFVITPGDSPILDLGLKIMTGADAERAYQGRRKEVMPALGRHFRIDLPESPVRGLHGARAHEADLNVLAVLIAP